MMQRRRRLLLLIPGALVAAAIACQSRPAAEAPEAPLRYVAIGASDTVGIGATVPDKENWPTLLWQHLPAGSQLVNLGVSGSLLGQALDQQLPVAIDADPDLVTVWLAVNDYGARVPLQRYAFELDTLIGELRQQTHATILVANIPDLSVLPAAGRFDLSDTDRWNRAIEEITARHGATLVDLRTTWRDVKDHPEYISSDGFHPSTAGYRRLADIFYDAARAARTAPAPA
jgi:lysophospholipase L1-like esterase